MHRPVSIAATLTALLVLPALGQTAEEIVARNIEAIGGAEAWANVQSMRSTGAISMMGGMAEGPIVVVASRPANMRVEVTVQGMDVVQAYDGEVGWIINPFAGGSTPQEADPLTVAAMQEQADLDGPFVGWQESGHSIALGESKTVEGVEAHAIDLTFPTGEVTTFYVHPESYMIIRVEAERPGVGNTTATIGDYREVDGVMVPFSASSVSAQGDQAVIWDSIEINVDLPESLFKMPDGDVR